MIFSRIAPSTTVSCSPSSTLTTSYSDLTMPACPKDQRNLSRRGLLFGFGRECESVFAILGVMFDDVNEKEVNGGTEG